MCCSKRKHEHSSLSLSTSFHGVARYVAVCLRNQDVAVNVACLVFFGLTRMFLEWISAD